MKSTKVARTIFFSVWIVILFTQTSGNGFPRRRSIRRTPAPCTLQDCTVSSWSSWNSCSYPCGNNGVQSRSRSIVTHPSCGGKPCPTLSETRACNRDNCLNQGTPHSTGCHCRPGYTGNCCQNGKLNSKSLQNHKSSLPSADFNSRVMYVYTIILLLSTLYFLVARLSLQIILCSAWQLFSQPFICWRDKNIS